MPKLRHKWEIIFPLITLGAQGWVPERCPWLQVPQQLGGCSPAHQHQPAPGWADAQPPQVAPHQRPSSTESLSKWAWIPGLDVVPLLDLDVFTTLVLVPSTNCCVPCGPCPSPSCYPVLVLVPAAVPVLVLVLHTHIHHHGPGPSPKHASGLDPGLSPSSDLYTI